mgnify:CR=1 FL=1
MKAMQVLIADAAREIGHEDPIEFSADLCERLASHKDVRREMLTAWLEDGFRAACASDVMRLKESLWMLKVGRDKGDTPEQMMGRAIASFVKGLILGEQPVTVPTENN